MVGHGGVVETMMEAWFTMRVLGIVRTTSGLLECYPKETPPSKLAEPETLFTTYTDDRNT